MIQWIAQTLNLAFREQWALENAINGLRSLATGGGARGFVATCMMILEMFGMILGTNSLSAWGQELDLAFEEKPATAEELREVHRNKTGMLINAAAQLGAVAASADDIQRQAIARYAFSVGLVFQIIDDILDVTATAQQLGKPIGSDAANGKTTFVTLHGVERSRGIAQELTDGACGVLRAAFGGRAQFLETLAASLLERNQ